MESKPPPPKPRQTALKRKGGDPKNRPLLLPPSAYKRYSLSISFSFSFVLVLLD
jgi:hypothetical protein